MKILRLSLLLLLLSACAKPLQPENYAERISTTRLDENIYLISYRGSTVNANDKHIDLTLLKSAETALEKGFNYFVIVKTSESVKTRAFTTPDNNIGQVDNNLGDGGYETTVFEGNTYVHTNPGVTNTIVCFKDRPQGFAYIALFLKASLRSKYKLNRIPGQT
ncbi:MAG: hypothetical protein GY896_09920 [Gammaproteobacteria bacterium]|nr:hypothetical protein [Gammaproteobacteria bacterium]